MSRSSKKGPYLDPKLMKKVSKAIETGDKKPIKTWARAMERYQWNKNQIECNIWSITSNELDNDAIYNDFPYFRSKV